MTSTRSVLAMLTATLLWGSASAVVTVANSPLSAPLVAAGASIALLLLAVCFRQNVMRTLRSDPRLYLVIGGLEAANLILYFAALHLGPTPVVVALHLSTPVLLIAHGLVTGQRKPNFLVFVEAGLITLAIVLIIRDQGDSPNALLSALGCALSLGSAIAVAMLIYVIASKSGERPAAASAGLQLGIAALLTSPLILATGHLQAIESVILFASGAALLGPGFLLYWVALKQLEASTAGVLGLNEAIVAAVLVGAIGAGDTTATTAVAGTLILTSVGLELLNRPDRVRN